MGLVSVVDRSILQGAKIPIDDKGGISLTNMLSKTLAPVTKQRLSGALEQQTRGNQSSFRRGCR